jgi:probable rRNA maturation factor
VLPAGAHAVVEVNVASQQVALTLNLDRLRSTVAQIVSDAGLGRAAISIAIVDDATIHRLNREFLAHDYPTDVLSFVLEQDDSHLEGEIILGAEQAIRVAKEYGWPAEHELLLYAIHGTLHLVGYDDQDEQSREQMRAGERKYLTLCGVTLPIKE